MLLEANNQIRGTTQKTTAIPLTKSSVDAFNMPMARNSLAQCIEIEAEEILPEWMTFVHHGTEREGSRYSFTQAR